MNSRTVRCEHIVLIEDDAAIRETLLLTLESEGYTVRGFRDGVEALEFLRAHPNTKSALILSDVMMPRMSGPEFLKTRREMDIWMNVPVIMMSASGKTKEIADIDAFVEKPIDLDLLLALVERYCQKQVSG